MGTKVVVGADGIAQEVPTTPEDDAQAATDAAVWEARQATAAYPDLLPYQFRAILALSGHQTALDDYIAGLADPAKTIAQAKLDYSLSFQRDNELVLAAQQALGLTDDQLNALWAQARAIT